jgi:hypothetical protein
LQFGGVAYASQVSRPAHRTASCRALALVKIDRHSNCVPDRVQEKLEGNAGQAERVGDDLVWPNSALRHLLRWSRIKPDADQGMKSI